ncbi:MAG: toxic anion resistance protein, partial [Actinomycetota bacterium]
NAPPPSTPSTTTTAPAVQSDLVLVPPAPVPDISTTQASSMMPVDSARAAELAERAKAFVAGLVNQDPHSPDYQTKLDDVANMGRDDIRAAANVSNTMLQRPVAALAAARGKGDDGDPQRQVAKTLVSLRLEVEDLDPSKADGGIGQMLLNLIPFRDKIRSYFARSASAQGTLDKLNEAKKAEELCRRALAIRIPLQSIRTALR